MSTTIIHSSALSDDQILVIAQRLGAEPRPFENHYRATHDIPLSNEALETLRADLRIDINPIPDGFKSDSVRLLITDMDSALINIECIDEIADFVGLKPQVAAITETAMRGELDFAASLTQRVALLKGLDISALERIYAERLKLNPGAESLMSGLKARGIKMALVSGGFTFFTERLKSRLGLDFTLANVLALKNGKLAGSIEGDIVDVEAKASYLQQLCEKLGIKPTQTIAMGDGTNDLKMLGIAGLGVAYYAKPAVREQADATIQHCDLDAVLDFLPKI